MNPITVNMDFAELKKNFLEGKEIDLVLFLRGIENMNDLDASGNPVIKKGSMRWSNIDYSKNRFQFIEDSLNRKIPSIWNEMEQQWKTIQNLHVHSKELVKGLSKPL